ncbi:hypothetical protein LIER_24348 [Lithospermum erythrorhizon]|uniref:Phytocyanin domain-containing protein n=1 Tax=Lithospermum erythrorhizon TaxID=34254 RepID=A0AAV3R3T6_LITER
MGKAELLVSFLLCISAVHAADHVVGDKNGWLDILVDYTEWAAGKKFVVGDKLIFNYDTTHDVAVVDKDGYDACIASTPPYTGGKTTITLTSPGLKYFICTISDHCSAGGMQLPITVEAGPPGGSTPTTPPSPSPSSTPPPSHIPPAPSSSSTPPTDSVPPSPIPPSDIPSPSPSSIPPSDTPPSPRPPSIPPSGIPPSPSPSEFPLLDLVPTPSPLQSPPTDGGVAGSFGSMNPILIGFSLISATLFAFMG